MMTPTSVTTQGCYPTPTAMAGNCPKLSAHFLTPEERRDLARALETALHRARMPQPTETLLA